MADIDSKRLRGGNQSTTELSERFVRFAKTECRGSSALYERLALSISEDDELLDLASHSAHRPVPNLFFAAIHYLLLKGEGPTLAAFYPDTNPDFDRDRDPLPKFREFCLQHGEIIKDILGTRLVQTNEVQRSVLLLPAFQLVASRTQKPLAIVEIGTSAGLNLRWDRYSYDYGNGVRCGDKESKVKLVCELRGRLSPSINRQLPNVTFRVGIDLHPINIARDDEVLWLKALIWPEHKNRMRLLDSAIRIAREWPIRIIMGDALEALPEIVQSSRPDSTLCIVSTFTLNQFSKESREKLEQLLTHEAAKRELCLVSVEYAVNPTRVYPELRLVNFSGKTRRDEVLANCEPHGEWLEWLLSDTDS